MPDANTIRSKFYPLSANAGMITVLA